MGNFFEFNEQDEGQLKLMPSGRWAICIEGRDPWEITSGDSVYIEIPGTGSMAPTRLETGFIKGRTQYYSVDGYKLRDGLRAAIITGGRI